MTGDELEPPPPFIGDYPHGAYWAAYPPPGWTGEAGPVEDEDSYGGAGLRIMWDETAGPLWGDEGLLPEDAPWMQRALGLSAGLAADLVRWNDDMTALYVELRQVADWDARLAALSARGEALAVRLRAEVGERYAVRFHP